ncbi:MAG: uracil-DNA glycosylase [Pseudomonadota bacterium]
MTAVDPVVRGFPAASEPGNPCTLCPRLHAFIEDQKPAHPDWHNGPVPSWGDPDARLLIVGLAPGLRGANRTGRPFTGDWAGDLLYATLGKFGFASGSYEARPDDGVKLHDAAITNAVRCVPPQNKPVGAEINTCNAFLTELIDGMPRLTVLMALGRISHDATLKALGVRRAAHTFGHGAIHALPGGLTMIDSYHCSRYNTNTGRLTTEMFESVFASICETLDEQATG